MIYELRVYTCLPGRMPALLKRFEQDTLRIWARHGIEQAGFWTTAVGASSNDLTYFLRWNSLAERETKWSAFVTDPEWIEAKNRSEADGLIVANIASQFLSPTKFSSAR